MPQSSYTYAVARVRALENGLIGQDKMARLAEGTLDEAVRTLVEAGYGDLPEAAATDCEKMISREMEKASQLIKEISPEPEITDLFLMRADIHNLKALIKARLLEQNEEAFLQDNGIFEKEKLAIAVRDQNYIDLPGAIKEALNNLEKELQAKQDPQRVSAALDYAYIEHALNVANARKSEFAQKYFRALADFNNVLAVLRVRAMGAPKEMLETNLLPAGNIAKSIFLNAMEQPFETMARVLATGPAGFAIAAGLEAVQQSGRNSALEKARDDYLMQLIKHDKYDVMTLQPVLGYLLAREQEAKCIRLIVTAKRNKLPDQVITERLREVYG